MEKKNFLQIMFTVIMVHILSFCLISCGGEENIDANNGGPVNPEATVNDPDGTILLSMRNSDNGKTYLDGIYIDKENFRGAFFASVGKVKGLGNVSAIPTTGWADQMSVIPGNGYVAYCNNQYYRIYVVDDIVSTSGGIMGADIKYQKPFIGINESIQVPSTSITINAVDTEGALSESIFFNNSNIIVYSVESNQTWCVAEKTTNLSTNFLYNGITILCQPNISSQAREAEIKLTTAFNNSITIKVKQTALKSESPAGSGTKESPYNVLGAIDYANQLENGKESRELIYVKGKIVSYSENVTSGENNLIISDSEGFLQLVISTDINYGNYLNAGDDVVVRGKIKHNDNSYRMTQTVICLNNGQSYDIEGKGTKEVPFSVMEAIIYAQTLGEKESSDDLFIKGEIASIVNPYTKNRSATFTITDPNSKSPIFTIDKTFYLGNRIYYDGDLQIKQGDMVIICGKVIWYYGKTPMTVSEKSYLYSLNGYYYPPVNMGDNFYLIGGLGEWTNSKKQKFQHSSKSIAEDPIFTYTFESNGQDMWFAFGDDEAFDAIGGGDWSKLFGTTGTASDFSGTFDRRYHLNSDNSFHVNGKAKYYRFKINVSNMTYTITELDSNK